MEAPFKKRSAHLTHKGESEGREKRGQMPERVDIPAQRSFDAKDREQTVPGRSPDFWLQTHPICLPIP
ncbi:MAG: hypothetical protein NVS2B12_07150 [Ktedonobacteraceae bacterium]